MGFCLFEEVDDDGFYMAVNPAHVDDIELVGDTKQGWPVSRLKFSFNIHDFQPIILGDPKDIHKTLMKGVKVGTGKISVTDLNGFDNMSAKSDLFNHPDRVGVIKEQHVATLPLSNIMSHTASIMILDDGTPKMIEERPGIVARRANAEGNVPFLDIRGLSVPKKVV